MTMPGVSTDRRQKSPEHQEYEVPITPTEKEQIYDYIQNEHINEYLELEADPPLPLPARGTKVAQPGTPPHQQHITWMTPVSNKSKLSKKALLQTILVVFLLLTTTGIALYFGISWNRAPSETSGVTHKILISGGTQCKKQQNSLNDTRAICLSPDVSVTPEAFREISTETLTENYSVSSNLCKKKVKSESDTDTDNSNGRKWLCKDQIGGNFPVTTPLASHVHTKVESTQNASSVSTPFKNVSNTGQESLLGHPLLIMTLQKDGAEQFSYEYVTLAQALSDGSALIALHTKGPHKDMIVRVNSEMQITDTGLTCEDSSPIQDIIVSGTQVFVVQMNGIISLSNLENLKITEAVWRLEVGQLGRSDIANKTDLVLCDSHSREIFVYDLHTQKKRVVVPSTDLVLPKSVSAMLDQGQEYRFVVADNGFNQIKVYDHHWKMIFSLGRGQSSSVHIKGMSPYDAIFTPSGGIMAIFKYDLVKEYDKEGQLLSEIIGPLLQYSPFSLSYHQYHLWILVGDNNKNADLERWKCYKDDSDSWSGKLVKDVNMKEQMSNQPTVCIAHLLTAIRHHRMSALSFSNIHVALTNKIK